LTSAADLAKEFAANPAAAKAKYEGKKVRVSGTVLEKSEERGAVNVVLEGLKDGEGALNVEAGIALLDEYSSSLVETIKKGDKVTLVGEVYVSSARKGRDGWSLVTCVFVR